MANGLVPDNTCEDASCRITTIGLALPCYVVGAARAEAIESTLTILRFFHDSPHGEMLNATDHKGFYYYHFLDRQISDLAADAPVPVHYSGAAPRGSHRRLAEHAAVSWRRE